MLRKRVTKGKSVEAAESAPEVMPVTATEVAGMSVGMISRDRFREKIKALHDLGRIKNDKGDEIAFDGESRKVFILACEHGYPIIDKTIDSTYEMGGVLYGVRDQLRPHKLYYVRLDFTGIPLGTARNYLQAYERHRDRLPQFAQLGIKKLLIASRLSDCVEYVEHHEEAIASQSAVELEAQINPGARRLDQRASRPEGVGLPA